MTRLTYMMAVACALVAVSTVSAGLPDPVRTDRGLVSGTPSVSADVSVFKGIPFATPPVVQLRWREPQPATAWEGVRKADQFGPRCMQIAQGSGGRGSSEAVTQPMVASPRVVGLFHRAIAQSARNRIVALARSRTARYP